MAKRLLFSLAHPDDESFGSGGLISKYVAEGVEIYYIVGTDGARGTVSPEFIEQFGSIEAVRDAEMDCAAETLGFKEVFKLGYKDSGMMGSPENNDSACLWQADESEVSARITELMQMIQPQVVVTFNPYGGYGHPDHIAMHRATTRAFNEMRESNNGYKPQKLYYSSISRVMMNLRIWQLRFKRKNPRAVGRNKDIDLVAIRDNILPTTTKIDIRDWFEAWDKASACHASQISLGAEEPMWRRKLLYGNQGLTRAYPHFHNGEPIETDLFQGVRGA